MGLDTVEIILRTEEVFSIELPDDECGQIVTVGDFYNLVLVKLDLQEEPSSLGLKGNEKLGISRFHNQFPSLHPWTSSDVWATLVDLIQDQLQVDANEITPTASFTDDLRCD